MSDPGEMTISAYDVAVFEEQKAERVRRHERSLQRWRSGATATGWVAAAATVLGIIYAIYAYNVGPSTQEELSHVEKLECIDDGGTWVKLADPDDLNGYGTCLFGKDTQ